MRQLSDPLTSRAVLIATSTYEHLKDRPTVATGCRRLARLFRDPAVWGLPAENCRLVVEPSRESLLDAVYAASNEATDTLVVYYAGHGLLYPRSEDLHLALPGTDRRRPYTAVNYQDIRSILLGATKVRRKVVVLDCCFSGTALHSLAGHEDQVDLAKIAGTSVLAASHATKAAWAPDGEKYPAFTGELIDLLENGRPAQPALFTMADLYRHLDDALAQKGRPRPKQFNADHGARISIARNRAAAEPPPEDPDGAAGTPAGGIRRWSLLAAAVLVAAVALGVPALVDRTHRHLTTSLPAPSVPPPETFPGVTCGHADDTFDVGDGKVRREVSIDVVHDAACKGDYDAMQVAMDRVGFDGYGFSSREPDDVVKAWKRLPDQAGFLGTLVKTLEQKPRVDQGGLEYVYDRHIAVWERGPGTVPDSQLRWSGYYDCTRDDSEPAC